MHSSDTEKTLLIVEDDPGLQKQLGWHFEDYTVVFASNRIDAITAIRQYEPAVILQDLGLPPDDEGVSEGFRCIEETCKLAPNSKIIVLTGNADNQNAVKAVALGAYDFYQKPVDTDVLDLLVRRAYQMHELEEKNRRLQETQLSPLEGIITADPGMLKICRTLEKIANADVTCTILGESGTGKEVLARAQHSLSSRAKNRFVAINCAAIPESLIESELFGHEKGAFTGANKLNIGKIETANNGTLFLDEIGDMPLNLQVKLLRFLQERVIERVGGREEIPVDVKVICATNKNIQGMISEGEFREDLYYRICEITLDIPPLRDRCGDKILLARAFLKKYAEINNTHITGFSPDALTTIENYGWPGNVRELENRIKRAVIMAEEKLLSTEDMNLNTSPELTLNLRQVRYTAERNAIIQSLSITDNNISATAKLLGLTRPTLYDLLKKYNVPT